jgi:hypothetical protein
MPGEPWKTTQPTEPWPDCDNRWSNRDADGTPLSKRGEHLLQRFKLIAGDG